MWFHPGVLRHKVCLDKVEGRYTPVVFKNVLTAVLVFLDSQSNLNRINTLLPTKSEISRGAQSKKGGWDKCAN